jgi:PAS domain-containing protein
MTPVRRLTAVLAALTVLFAACSGGADEVGRTGDTVFTTDDLIALYEDDWFDSDAIEINEERRADLFRLLAIEALMQAAEADFGLVPDPVAVQDLFDERQGEIRAANATVGDFLGVPGASEEMLRLNSEFGVLRRDVINELVTDEEFIRDLYEDGRGFTTVCVRHILVATLDEGEDVAARLEAGEDFAALAAEVSIDTATPGGDLGCSLASRYVESFAFASVQAEIGEYFGPFESEFGFHVLIVDDRTAPTIDEVLANPSSYVPESEGDYLWSDWFNRALQEAEVEVSERFGSWSPVGIAPPEA